MSTDRKNPDNIQTIDANRHRKLRVKPNPGSEHARQQHVVGIMLSELAVCASTFPLVLIERPDAGKYQLVAILGLRSGENVFYGPQFWESPYVPLGIQRHPFIIGYDDRLPNGEQITTCVEIDSPFLSEKEGIPLFTETGEQSDFLKGVDQLLSAMFESQKLTGQFIQKLIELDLVCPLNLLLQKQDGEVRQVAGLFTLDELKLKALTTEQLRDLHQSDFLAPCYIMLASLHQLNPMVRMRNRRGTRDEQITDFRLEFNVPSPATA